MPSIFGRLFSGTCQIGAVGALCAAAKYKYDYSKISTDPKSTFDALSTFFEDRRDTYDVAIVGGGIVGVATARELSLKYPKMRVILLEQEADVAQHQSGHNSGCIHAGMFYKPGTLMARLCPRGHNLIIDYCRKNKLPMELCGKLIVASNEDQIPTLMQMYEWGNANGVQGLEMLKGEKAIKEKESAVVGVAALWSPNTGIVDFAEVTRHMHKELLAKPKNFVSQFQFEVLDFVGVRSGEGKSKDDMVLIRGRERGQLGPEKIIAAKRVITCCGVANDLVAKRSGSVLESIGMQIVQTYSFRGRYYQMKPEGRTIVHSHVYPCLDDRKAINVGIHFTPTVDVRRGRQVILGPSSAVAMDRYGYNPYMIDLEYCFHSAFSKGGWMSLYNNFSTLCETYYMDISRRAFLREAQKLIPSLKANDVEESFCGVMSLGVGKDGSLVHDLAMEYARPRVTVKLHKDTKRNLLDASHADRVSETDCTAPLLLNVRNAPSPAATACMSIAEDIVASAGERFGWKK